MQKSISRKAGIIVSATLTVTLVGMVTAMLLLQNSAMMRSTDEQVHDINDLLVKSLTFSMSQGATDLGAFIDSAKKVRGLADLEVLPSDKIRKVGTAAMDPTELRVLRSRHPVTMREIYGDQPVYRLVEPVVADQRCNRCHLSSSGDVLAVVSLRYSLAGVEASLDTQRTTGIVFALIAIGVTLLMSMYFIRRRIIEDLKTSIGDIQKLSDGDTSEIPEIKRDDEIGDLNLSLKKLQRSLTRRAEIGVRFAEGDFREEVVLLSDQDVLGKAFAKIRDRLKSLVSDAKSLSVAAVEGRLHERAASGGHDGEFREIIVNFNDTLDAIVSPIEESSRVLEKMSKGDLTVRMAGDYRGDYGIIKDSINSLADSFSAAMADVTKTVYSTSAAAGEISSSAEQVAVGAHEQSLQAAEVASSVEEMTRTIVETTKNAATAADSAKEAGEIAREGGNAVRDTIVGMNRIAERVRKSAQSIEALGKSGEEIGRIIQVIDDIADQTNLLALNAAIEAARAGDQGRGFAVVADEVRKLAERTTNATKEISSMIKQIQSDTFAAVESMDEGTGEVEKGKVLTDKAGRSLQRIITSAERVVDVVTQVAAASEQQASSAEQISRSIESISNVTQESATGVQQIAHASEDLSKLTANLQSMISHFKYQKQAELRDAASGRVNDGSSIGPERSDINRN